ncbi:MAG TPA: pyruvate ferredoxin oxidoreductase [Ruminococcaceae bacterium]|nr:pyruvate ferredoxin oxidoreductase [Oscillospiraceae bacterium]
MLSCLIAGVGGQGTVLMSRLIGAAAIKKGFEVRGTETIGMAQRGGSVTSHVRMGEKIHSPLIPQGKADTVIAFEPGEAVRVLPFLKPDGVIIVCDRAVPPVMSALSAQNYDAGEMIEYLKKSGHTAVILNGEEIIRRIGGAKAVNVALLGAAAVCGALPFDIKELEQIIKERVPARFLEMNIQALRTGAEMGKGEQNEDDK